MLISKRLLPLSFIVLLMAAAGSRPASAQYRPVPDAPEPRNPNSWSHLTFEAGGGFTSPVGPTTNYLNTGFNVTLGGGYNLNKRLGLLAEYQFNRSNIPVDLLAALGQPGGNVHIWSVTLDPIYRYKTSGHIGGYVTGGGGFYRELTSFTYPVNECDYYGYCSTTNELISHYSSNQAGANLGFGFTFKPDITSRGGFYAEARYHWVDTPGSYTQIIPVTFGYRF